MESTLPKAQFSKRYEFIGNIRFGDYIANDLQIILQYSQEQDGPILGRVIGTTETLEKLVPMRQQTGPEFELYTSPDSPSSYRINSSQVIIRSVMYRHFEGRQNLFSYEVADLELLDLTMQRDLELYDRENNPRYITFFLCGPRLLWLDNHMRVVSFTGSAEILSHESEIELETELPFKIHAAPHYLYDTTLEPTKRELSTNVQTLVFKTELPESAYSNFQFVEDAKAAAEDLTLLVSFLSQRHIIWFRYELSAASIFEEYIRTSHKCSSIELRYDGGLIDLSEVRPFLKKAFGRLRELREDNFNLLMPIAIFITGNEAEYLEDKFAISFLALEKLKDMHAKKKGLDKIIKTGPFDRLSKKIRVIINDSPKPEDSEDLYLQIKEKISELNRPTLMYILESLFKEYDVQWNDLYPNNGDFTLVKTRNVLFHSSDTQDGELLMNELDRLRIIITRILLRMLGYEGRLPSPPSYLIS